MSIIKFNFQQFLLKLFLFGWLMVAFSITVSKVATSIAQIIIITSWILTWDWKSKWEKIKTAPKYFWAITGLYFLFLLGLWNTTDFSYAVKDLRIKLPLLFLPIFYYTGPVISNYWKKIVLVFFVLGVLTSVICGIILNFNVVGTTDFDFRKLSPFVSHIQLNQSIGIALLIMYYFLFKNNSKLRWLILLPVPFFIYYYFYTESLTAYLVLIIAFLIIVYHNFRLWSKWLSRLFIFTFILVTSYFSIQIFEIYQLNFKTKPLPKELPKYTKNNNPYIHYTEDKRTENGYYIGYFIQNEELKEEWTKISNVPFDSKIEGYPIIETISRFLTSKGLPKDSFGLAQLSTNEIKAIEDGIANVYYLENGGIKKRIHQTFWEFKSWQFDKYISTSSVVLRLYYWQVATQLFKNNFWTGIGTGDVKKTFKNYYQNQEQTIPNRVQRRTHNQYLTAFLTFGVFGGTVFMILIGYIFFVNLKINSVLSLGTTIIILIGFTYEDAMETQAGITLVVFGWLWMKQKFE